MNADAAEAEAHDRAWAAEIYRRLDETYGTPDWRPYYAPVDELVLTILSQNTNDINSLRAFEALKARYPTWQAVLAAPVDELAHTIRTGGLGPQKAPRIQAALQRIQNERGDFNLDFLAEWPVDRALDWLVGFNGIGPKTASIVLLFCFGKAAFPVDTHITRITRRLGLVGAREGPERIQHVWEALVPAEQFYSLHLNLIRHGREVCRAPRPRCPACVLNPVCNYPEKTR